MTKRLVAYFVTFLVFFGCSQSSPVISDVKVKVVKIQTDDYTLIERLSVFVEYDDKDGQNDFRSLSVLHNDSGLVWDVPNVDLSFFTLDNFSDTHYITGTNKIAPIFNHFFVGDYKITIYDLGYQEHSYNFKLNKIDNASGFPFDIYVGDTWRVDKHRDISCKVVTLLLLGADKQTIHAKRYNLSIANGSIAEIKKEWKDARYIRFLFDFDDVAFLSKIYNLTGK